MTSQHPTPENGPTLPTRILAIYDRLNERQQALVYNLARSFLEQQPEKYEQILGTGDTQDYPMLELQVSHN